MGWTPEKRQVTILDVTITTDKTAATASGYTGRRFKGLKPPYVLMVRTTNAGSTAPSTLSVAVQVQDSADGTNYTSVSGFTNTAIAAAGTQTARKTEGGQMANFVRAIHTSTASTWNAGTRIVAWLVGEGVG